LEECGPCPVFASYTLAFALQLRKKHGKPSVRVAQQKEYTDLTIKIHKLQYLTGIQPYIDKNRN
jgi:hypothetical protein